MFLFIFLLTIGFLYELFLGAIDLYFLIFSRKVLYLWFFLFNICARYLYGYILKTRNLYIFTKERFLLPLVYFLKYNELYLFQSLLDIVVVDLINVTKLNRFVLNYVF